MTQTQTISRGNTVAASLTLPGSGVKGKPYYAMPDGMPNEMWCILHIVEGAWETVKTTSAPGWYRTRSEAKARRDADRLSRGLKVAR